MKKGCLVVLVLVVALAACKRESQPVTDKASPATETAPAAPVSDAAAVLELKDVIEHNERYIVGISYTPGIAKYPVLARAVANYAEAARGEMLEAVDGLGNDKPQAPYELSLNFEEVLDTPRVVAVSAEGSRYTGGAHGQPLVARFVWLPQQSRMLTAESMITSANGWAAVAAYVREQLHTQVSLRADAEELSQQERMELVRNADKMIDEGTEPDVANFSQFQPILDEAGMISALRFVFPPYQVGPYSDGTQTVDVPVSVLRPYIAPEYAALFGQ